jgi:hypothetical protein
MRRLFLDYLGKRGPRIFSTWLPYAILEDPAPNSPRRCLACRRAYNSLTSLFGTVDLGQHRQRRRLSFCPSCGVTEDAPSDSDASLSVDAFQTVRLSYQDAFQEPWAGVLVVKSQLFHDRVVYKWPANGQGKPAQRLVFEQAWPAGPLDVGLIILSGAKLTIVMQRGRRRVTAPPLQDAQMAAEQSQL